MKVNKRQRKQLELKNQIKTDFKKELIFTVSFCKDICMDNCDRDIIWSICCENDSDLELYYQLTFNIDMDWENGRWLNNRTIGLVLKKLELKRKQYINSHVFDEKVNND